MIVCIAFDYQIPTYSLTINRRLTDYTLTRTINWLAKLLIVTPLPFNVLNKFIFMETGNKNPVFCINVHVVG